MGLLIEGYCTSPALRGEVLHDLPLTGCFVHYRESAVSVGTECITGAGIEGSAVGSLTDGRRRQDSSGVGIGDGDLGHAVQPRLGDQLLVVAPRRQADDLPMYVKRPARRAAFIDAWSKIDAYVAAHYVAAATVEGMTIYRLNPDASK